MRLVCTVSVVANICWFSVSGGVDFYPSDIRLIYILINVSCKLILSFSQNRTNISEKIWHIGLLQCDKYVIRTSIHLTIISYKNKHCCWFTEICLQSVYVLILTYIAGPLSCENSQWKMMTWFCSGGCCSRSMIILCRYLFSAFWNKCISEWIYITYIQLIDRHNQTRPLHSRHF